MNQPPKAMLDAGWDVSIKVSGMLACQAVVD
jgi:hypothetical protein